MVCCCVLCDLVVVVCIVAVMNSYVIVAVVNSYVSRCLCIVCVMNSCVGSLYAALSMIPEIVWICCLVCFLNSVLSCCLFVVVVVGVVCCEVVVVLCWKIPCFVCLCRTVAIVFC